MRHYRLLLSLFLTLQFASNLAAQTTDPIKEREEEIRRAAMERFIPKSFSRDYSTEDIRPLENLEPLIEKLDQIVPLNSESVDLDDHTKKPIKSFGRIIKNTVREREDSKLVSNVWLRMWSYASLKQAEEGLAENGSRIAVALNWGTLTGTEVGELSYHYSENNTSAYIIFLRRNVVVSLSCKGPYEVSKDAKKRPGPFLDDPELKNKCDALAKQLDGFIVNLTNK